MTKVFLSKGKFAKNIYKNYSPYMRLYNEKIILKEFYLLTMKLLPKLTYVFDRLTLLKRLPYKKLNRGK